jgi:hypothetical protein
MPLSCKDKPEFIFDCPATYYIRARLTYRIRGWKCGEGIRLGKGGKLLGRKGQLFPHYGSQIQGLAAFFIFPGVSLNIALAYSHAIK